MVELRIIVPEELIMDGVVDIPSVGDYVEYTIAFRQAGAATPPRFCTDVEARVEQLNEGRLSQDWIDSCGQNHPGTYAMLLYGDRWCAYFRSTTPYEGVVQLSGVFEADWAGVIPAEAQVAGTVVDRQLITRTSSPDTDGRHRVGVDVLGPVREGQSGFRSGLVPEIPIPADPRGWRSAMIPPRDGPWVREIGILVDLTLT